MHLRQKLSFFFLLFLIFQLKGQEVDFTYFTAQEKNLQSVYQQIIKEQNEQKAAVLQEEFFNQLYKVFATDNSRFYDFDSLKYIGKITSPNQKLIVYTWNFSKHFGYSDYYGIVQYVDKKGKQVTTYRLRQLKETVEDAFLYICDTNKWVGALYYQIVETKYKGTECYTLLGYNFNDVLSNKKVLDAIAISKEGTIRFEPNMFFFENRVCNRIEFQYAESAQMLLSYNAQMEKIVYDHLAPMRPSLEGQYQFYGPDASYDGFYFEEGIWRHVSNILIEN